MAIKGSDLVNMTKEEIWLAMTPAELRNCSVCGKSLFGREVVTCPLGRMHEDCYYDELGKLVEEHPIVNPERLVRR